MNYYDISQASTQGEIIPATIQIQTYHSTLLFICSNVLSMTASYSRSLLNANLPVYQLRILIAVLDQAGQHIQYLHIKCLCT